MSVDQKTGRVLPSIELQKEIEQANIARAIETASNDYLSRLFAFDADMPVRFDPPVNLPAPADKSVVINPGPDYFYSGNGNGKSKSRTRVATKRYARFGRR